MRNSKSQACGVPGRRRGGRAVVGRRTAGATDVRALADDLGAVLLRAVRQGVAGESPAGISCGVPQGPAAGISWYAFAREYMEMRWPLIAAKSRDETNDALCEIIRAMLRDVRGRPSDELLRRAMRGWAFWRSTSSGSPRKPVPRCSRNCRSSSASLSGRAWGWPMTTPGGGGARGSRSAYEPGPRGPWPTLCRSPGSAGAPGPSGWPKPSKGAADLWRTEWSRVPTRPES
jgi:hypothetical protein